MYNIDENSKEQAVERCCKHFEDGYNCCETVLLAFSEILGMENNTIPEIATPFGGGIHQRQYMCGALTGALMAIGLKYGRSTAEGDREIPTEKSRKIIEKFIERYGNTNCIEILGYGPGDLEKIQQDKPRIKATICTPLIKQVAQWLWEELND